MNNRSALATLALAIGTAACATGSTFSMESRDLRVARDTPISFVTVDGISGVADGCSNPLIDPRDQTRIHLVRSGSVGAAHHGDYAVAQGRYGVGASDLLRIDCSTGQVVGIVPN